ncbi:hypothetical protein ETH_00016990 [Eimeria tenella]|uniref:Nucleoside diphosphate kinase n=1 Tax=Eimeria tenella TaxID=5802 RepID=U6KVH9_EIMTE|nr:hypothetical protein ETH_00016990 [Eimeria tenella]CDJ39505.1 hypothetical protein ETH_00016990 [Eimeria tenella]|eukprot:XP_013230260.1 hypothetical protein ETH_00016990 [Eimeria tenella]
MAARPGDGAVLLLFPEILRQKKEEANGAFAETPEGWIRSQFIEELTQGLSSIILLQHPLGKTRKRLAESLAAAASLATTSTTDAAAAAAKADTDDDTQEEDETGLAEAFRKAFCIGPTGPQQFYLSTCRWTFERDVLFFYPSVKPSQVERSVLLVKPNVTAAVAAAEARGESCPEKALEVLLLEEGLTILASINFQPRKRDIQKLFPGQTEKVLTA